MPVPRGFLIIVRRDRDEVFHVFEKYYSGSKFVVVRDRRGTERRTQRGRVSVERRQAERHGPLPSSWLSPGYVLVPRSGEE